MVKEVAQLRVYRNAFRQADRLFWCSQKWPSVEKYALTSQIRRSSRSVCANLSEAWRKRRYPAHFISKLSDADAEAAETRTWLRFALACSYIEEDDFKEYDTAYDHICGGLVRMMYSPDRWCGPKKLSS